MQLSSQPLDIVAELINLVESSKHCNQVLDNERRPRVNSDAMEMFEHFSSKTWLRCNNEVSDVIKGNMQERSWKVRVNVEEVRRERHEVGNMSTHASAS